VGPRGIVVGDFIQAADAVEDSRHPSEQDRHEASHRAENEGSAVACDITCESCPTSGTKSMSALPVDEVNDVPASRLNPP